MPSSIKIHKIQNLNNVSIASNLFKPQTPVRGTGVVI